MILITGASGNLERRVAETLAQHGRPLRLLVKSARGAPEFAGTHLVAGDFADPAVLDCAFAGIETAFISFEGVERDMLEQHRGKSIEAARRAGVAHLVYVSVQGAAPDSTFADARRHHSIEELLERSGIPYAALRANLYLDMLPVLFFNADVARGHAGDQAAAFVSQDDVERVVAAALSRPDVIRGVIDVTGPEALTLTEVARRLSAIHGRTFRYEYESAAATQERLERAESPAEMALSHIEGGVGSYYHEAIASGTLAAVSDAVTRYTGRPAQPLGSSATSDP
jgi:uncharacterized protein YbjT (DUF2867 family)